MQSVLEPSTNQQRTNTPSVITHQKPATPGRGKFFHVQVRPKRDFVSFRTHDVGQSGGLERVTGRRTSGSWATVAWLISKDAAYCSPTHELIITDTRVRSVLKSLEGPIIWIKGDTFKAKPRKNVPEKSKPTPAQREAWSTNIKKAQAARLNNKKSASL